ncbi:helix-turn-helix domain-containing protein [Nitratireductor sp. GISD-1A_MAKvit]|uniref:helix-turn-helix transcriptional regulator n=1 Tax=Nitratireductor sp. GISD-1A_MAKvit TaxID=3234198 RepID=UPI003465CC1D
MKEQRYLTLQQLAERLQVTTRTLRHWAQQGKLPGAVKLYKCWRVKPDEVVSWLNSLEQPSAATPSRSRMFAWPSEVLKEQAVRRTPQNEASLSGAEDLEAKVQRLLKRRKEREAQKQRQVKLGES